MAKKESYRHAYSDLMSHKSWLIEEPKWDPKQQAVRETQFTLGNGFVCCRGVLEERPYDSYAGTYMGGLYDRTGAQITELVNLPNPLQFRIDTYGENSASIAAKNSAQTCQYRLPHPSRILENNPLL